MTYVHSRYNVDKNQREIVNALRAIGCSVLDLSRMGKGTPDILVFCPRLHAYCLVEIKSDKGKMTPAQKKFHADWRGPVVVVKSVDEALKVFARDAA
jgi:hypothetical protein